MIQLILAFQLRLNIEFLEKALLDKSSTNSGLMIQLILAFQLCTLRVY